MRRDLENLLAPDADVSKAAIRDALCLGEGVCRWDHDHVMAPAQDPEGDDTDA